MNSDHEEYMPRPINLVPLIVGVIIGVPLLVVAGILIYDGLPTIRFFAPWIIGAILLAVAGSVIYCILTLPAALRKHLQVNAEVKSIQARTLRANANNAYPVIYDADNNRMIQAVNGQLPTVTPAHYSPTITKHNDPKELYKIWELTRQPALEIAGPPVVDENYLPEPYKFSDVLANWQPTKDGILLAKKQGLITVPLGEDMCHTTFTGNTDSGKTNDERFLLIQLLFLEQIVYLCDRNYQQYRIDKKMGGYYDYEPIANLLAHEPIYESKRALDLMVHLYGELEDRRARRRHNRVVFPDIYFMMDELPAFCGEEPEIMQYVGKFLRESRQYGIFFIGAAQDLLNQTLENDNGAIRDNLLTNVYGGGDMTTARQVLAMGKGDKIDETGLGQKGIKYLRAKGARIERSRVRMPWSDETATQMLLGDRSPIQKNTIPAYEEAAPDKDAIETNVIPMRQSAPRKATLVDAITVWNECGVEMGRPRLREELIARGLECSDDLAKTLLKNIKQRLESDAGGAGGASV